MGVEINIHPTLLSFTDNQEVVQVNGGTVGQCLEQLVARFHNVKERLFNKDGKLLSHVDLYINEESAYPEEMAKPVNDGDELHIVLMISGG